MKKLILLALCTGLIVSCTDKYTAKDKTGAPILIIDREGVIDDAIALELDSIYVKSFNLEDFYTPLRTMGVDQTIVTNDTINDEPYVWFSIYRVVYMNTVIKK